MQHTENLSSSTFLYTYACHEEERSLCQLESRSLFGKEPEGSYVESPLAMDPSRSPFIKMRVAVQYEGGSPEHIAQQVQSLQLHGATFKVAFVETDNTVDYTNQRDVERLIGLHIHGKAEMRKPERLFGVVKLGERWLFGECRKSEAVWLQHQAKAQNYSTALSTRVARAVANIAVPNPIGIRAIDPCCGIGTVLIEALSMGIDMVGYDINPLAVRGARANLAHFGLPSVVAKGDIRELNGSYDVAIVDMPYNLCSKLSPEEQIALLNSARRLAEKAVIITTKPLDSDLERVGFVVSDQCVVRKGTFARHIVVCH